MAARSEWLDSEELDILDQLLMEDDVFEVEIQSSIEKMPKEDKSFPCSMCKKICLSSGGLKRRYDVKTKHNVNIAEEASASSSSWIPKMKVAEDILHPSPSFQNSD